MNIYFGLKVTFWLFITIQSLDLITTYLGLQAGLVETNILFHFFGIYGFTFLKVVTILAIYLLYSIIKNQKVIYEKIGFILVFTVLNLAYLNIVMHNFSLIFK
jgi:hypothetical protein